MRLVMSDIIISALATKVQTDGYRHVSDEVEVLQVPIDKVAHGSFPPKQYHKELSLPYHCIQQYMPALSP